MLSDRGQRHNHIFRRLAHALLCFSIVLAVLAPCMTGAWEGPAFQDAVFHPDAAYVDGNVSLDLSCTYEGYMAVSVYAQNRLKCQVLKDETTYTYDIHSDGTPSILPLQSGSGIYQVRILENVQDTKYAMLYSCDLLKRYNIRFREGLKYSEDKIFSLQCMYLADRIYQENKIMYLYRTVASSAMSRRPFGIPYYRPIIDAYLEMDREMAQWATPERGVLMVGRICASRYIVYMLQEHFQQWRGKKEIDDLLRKNPEYVAIVKREPPFGYMPRNPEFEVYEASPVKYIWKHRMLGIKLALRRCAGRIIKRFL